MVIARKLYIILSSVAEILRALPPAAEYAEMEVVKY